MGSQTNNRVKNQVGNRVGKRVKQALDDLVIDLRQFKFWAVFFSFFLFFKGNRLCSLASVPIKASPG